MISLSSSVMTRSLVCVWKLFQWVPYLSLCVCLLAEQQSLQQVTINVFMFMRRDELFPRTTHPDIDLGTKTQPAIACMSCQIRFTVHQLHTLLLTLSYLLEFKQWVHRMGSYCFSQKSNQTLFSSESNHHVSWTKPFKGRWMDSPRQRCVMCGR